MGAGSWHLSPPPTGSERAAGRASPVPELARTSPTRGRLQAGTERVSFLRQGLPMSQEWTIRNRAFPCAESGGISAARDPARLSSSGWCRTVQRRSQSLWHRAPDWAGSPRLGAPVAREVGVCVLHHGHGRASGRRRRGPPRWRPFVRARIVPSLLLPVAERRYGLRQGLHLFRQSPSLRVGGRHLGTQRVDRALLLLVLVQQHRR
jgi:hypothetical protein